MKVNGKRIKWADKAHTTIQMDQRIKVNGNKTNQMEREVMNSQMALFTKVNGKIINCMELDFLLIIQDLNGKDNLEMAHFKAKNKHKC